MLVVTTNYIPGKEFDLLGMVTGATIQCKHIGKDIGAGFKNLVGGEMKAYTQMVEEARQSATSKMIEKAAAIGADAVIDVRYATTTVVQGGAEIIAYGTAVKFK